AAPAPAAGAEPTVLTLDELKAAIEARCAEFGYTGTRTTLAAKMTGAEKVSQATYRQMLRMPADDWRSAIAALQPVAAAAAEPKPEPKPEPKEKPKMRTAEQRMREKVEKLNPDVDAAEIVAAMSGKAVADLAQSDWLDADHAAYADLCHIVGVEAPAPGAGVKPVEPRGVSAHQSAALASFAARGVELSDADEPRTFAEAASRLLALSTLEATMPAVVAQADDAGAVPEDPFADE
ncbi:MAG: hypothetical protein KGK07_17410, partial [Chloroflexota bacterium]|nr:hypothetical protein [Chloroflexota bacterium]